MKQRISPGIWEYLGMQDVKGFHPVSEGTMTYQFIDDDELRVIVGGDTFDLFYTIEFRKFITKGSRQVSYWIEYVDEDSLRLRWMYDCESPVFIFRRMPSVDKIADKAVFRLNLKR